MMGEIMDDENAAFWLPSHFLTDDDFLDSPLTSPHKPGAVDIDSDYVSELTRYLARSSLHDPLPTTTNNTHNQKAWMISTSPQSTLTGFGPCGFSGNGSPNGPSQVPSPPLTPELENDAAWDLLYEAAGQVARLKMNAIAAHLNAAHTRQGILSAPRQPTTNPHNLYNNTHQYEQVKWGQENHPMRQQQERENSCYCPHHHHVHHQRRSCGATLGLPQSAWPALCHRHGHNQYRHQGIYGGGTRSGVGAVKRQSTGTGVFLPRRAATTPPRQHYQPEPRRKPSVVGPGRTAHTLNLDSEDTNLNSHAGLGNFIPSGTMIARMNAMVAQQRRNNMTRINEKNTGSTLVGPGHELRLPSDWTY